MALLWRNRVSKLLCLKNSLLPASCLAVFGLFADGAWAQEAADETQHYVVETNCNGHFYRNSRVRFEDEGRESRVILVDGTPCIAAGSVLLEITRGQSDTWQGLHYVYGPGMRIGYGFTTPARGFSWTNLRSDRIRFNDGRGRGAIYRVRPELPLVNCHMRFDSEAGISDDTGFRCLCPSLSEVSESWMPGVTGTDIYTSRSNICRAAVHAGAIGDQGGEVHILRPVEPNAWIAKCPYFYGSDQNGVSSEGGGIGTAYYFAGSAGLCDNSSPPESSDIWYCRERFSQYDQDLDVKGPFSCHCSEAATSFGTVFGTEHYTGDSSICLAAFHWGAVGAEGGTVQVVPEPGRSAYRGSTRNEVTSYNWRTYPFGFRFE